LSHRRLRTDGVASRPPQYATSTTIKEGKLAMSSRNKTTVHDEPRERTSSTRFSGHRVSRSNLQVKIPEENVMPAARTVDATAIDEELSARRLNVMRFGYAFMGVGLAIVKWPVLVQNAQSLPVMEGVVVCLLTAMSLLAFLGLRYPIRMLPILLFEVTWKVIWIAALAVPHLVSDDMNAATREMLFSCAFVVVILAVIPWRYAWRRYVRTPGDAWR
jgi:hypothetical protein